MQCKLFNCFFFLHGKNILGYVFLSMSCMSYSLVSRLSHAVDLVAYVGCVSNHVSHANNIVV